MLKKVRFRNIVHVLKKLFSIQNCPFPENSSTFENMSIVHFPYIFPEIMSHSEFSHATFFPSNFFQSSNICQRLTLLAVEVKRESSSLLLGFPKKRKRRKKKKDLVVLGVLGPFRSRTLHPPLSAQPPLLDLRTHLSKSQCVEERARTQLQCAKARARPRAFCRRRSWRDPWQP